MAFEFTNASDEELARQTQAGSLSAFEELVARYEARIYGFTAHACRNPADARELTQDTFVRAFQAIGQFDPRRSFAPWLFTIARRKCIDHHRAQPAIGGEILSDAADPDNPAELLARREDRAQLWRLARAQLSDAQFHALWLRYAEDMAVADIATVLGKTQTLVKVLLFRARRTLAARLQSLKGNSACARARLPVGPSARLKHPGLSPAA